MIEITVYGTRPPDPPPPTADPGIPDDVSLTVDGRDFVGWQEVQITRGIERMPSSFEMTVTERYPGAGNLGLMPGKSCKVRPWMPPWPLPMAGRRISPRMTPWLPCWP